MQALSSPPTCQTSLACPADVSSNKLSTVTEEYLQADMRGALRRKSTELLLALEGRLRRHHRDMIRFSYEHLQFIEQKFLAVEHEIEKHLMDRQAAVELLTTIPASNGNAAAVILAEIGTDRQPIR